MKNMQTRTRLCPTGSLRQNIARLVLLFVLCGLLLPGTLWAATYYVDATGGVDTNDGITLPWQTLNQVNGTTFAPGDQVLFKRGEVWHNNLVISSSGAAGKPITFGAYGDSADPLPLFDGTDSNLTWTDEGGGIYSAPWPSEPGVLPSEPGVLYYKGAPKPAIATLDFSSSVSGVQVGAVLVQSGGSVGYCNLWVTSVDAANKKISGITFFREAKHWDASVQVQVRQLVSGREDTSTYLSLATSDLKVYTGSLTEPGHWYWDSETNRVYVRFDGDPAAAQVKIGNKQYGIDVRREAYLTIEDIKVQGFNDAGVYLSVANNITVQRLEVEGTGSNGHKKGIMLNGSSDCTITGNLIESVLSSGIGIFSTNSVNAFRNTLSNNRILNPGGAGISFEADADLIQYTTIDRNFILNANSLAYDGGGVYALSAGVGRENRITNNTILYGGSKYLRSAGIMIDKGASPVTITGNRIENNSLGGIVVTGEGHTITGNRLTDNGVASWESAQVLFFSVNTNASGCTVLSNTMTANNSQKLFLVMNGQSTAGDLPHSIDYNTYSSKYSNTFCWSNDWSCDQWVNFSGWKNESGQDAHSAFSLITEKKPSGKSINSIYQLLL